MRITSNMMMDHYLKNLNNNVMSLSDIQNQVATGKRITRVSDDPIGSIYTMKYTVMMGKLEQYQDNVDSALTWIDQTETSAMELNKIIQNAYETAVHVSSDYMTEEDKTAAAELIAQLRDHVITIGNSKFGDKYIFGGYNVNKEPFTLDASGKLLYNGLDLDDPTNTDLIDEDGVQIQYEVGLNMLMSVSVTGSSLIGMGDDNIYNILNNLYNALSADADATELTGYADQLQAAQSRTLAVVADLGGRTNRLELLEERYAQDTLTYRERKSNIEDIDQAEALMNYKMAEYVYSAALQIGSEVIQPSLVDFLD